MSHFANIDADKLDVYLLSLSLMHFFYYSLVVYYSFIFFPPIMYLFFPLLFLFPLTGCFLVGGWREMGGGKNKQ